MSVRAVVVGLLGAAFIAGVGYLNDYVAGLTYLVGNHLPNSVFGLLLLLVLAVNPLLGRLRARWVFRPAELAVIVAVMLVACSVPNSGLMRYFPRAIVMPIAQNQVMPGWRRADVLGYVPEALMPAGGAADSQVVDGFVVGWGRPGEPIGLSDVPWSEWATPLAAWMPLIVLCGVCVVCMSLVVHRQWASHESLRYPVADFAESLLRADPQTGAAPIFRNRLFWAGLLTFVGFNLVNGFYAWNPDSVQIPREIPLTPLAQKWPGIAQTPGGYQLLTLRLYPAVVAFCFLLSSEVGLSLGISQIAFVLVAAPLTAAGVDLAADRMSGGLPIWQRFGSFVGTALLVGYVGRRYYWATLSQALAFGRRGEVPAYAVWACRAFLVSAAAMVVVLVWLGLDWPLAVLAVALVLLMFLVIARLNVECGLFFVTPFWVPLAVMIGLFGPTALGPVAIVTIGLLSMVFCLDARECLMPFVVNGLKVCDDMKVRPGWTGVGTVGVYAMALAIVVPVVLWTNQNFSAQKADVWASQTAPRLPFNAAERAVTQMKNVGELDLAERLAGWQRLAHMDPDPRFLWAAGVGVMLVIVFSVLRLRFTWWPLHPVMFVVWGTYALWHFNASFLLGWFIKKMVTRFGGAPLYRQARPLMFGVIAGELLGGLIFMVLGACYYAVTGLRPDEYKVFPG